MSAAGLQTMRDLKFQGVKQSIAADIWSDSSVSLLGTMLYYNWEGLHEIILGCEGSGTLELPYESKQKLTWKMLYGCLKILMPKYQIRVLI